MDKKFNLDGLVVVAKRKGKFFTGGIKNGKFVRYRAVKKLTDLKRRDEYVTLAAYLKMVGDKTKPEGILVGLNLERLYIHQPVSKGAQATSEKVEALGGMTEKAWEKVWWESYFPACVKCSKGCKQSSMILSLHCPSRA